MMNVATCALTDALRELVAARQLRQEVLRRKQRRKYAIKRDPDEVSAVDRLELECKVRESRAWNVAQALVARAPAESIDTGLRRTNE